MLNDPDDFSGGSSGGFIIRYQADGQLDSGFATGGIFKFGSNRYTGYGVAALALQRDGKLLILTNYSFESDLSRLNSDGQYDLGYGRDKSSPYFYVRSAFPSLAIQEDGRAIIGASDAAGYQVLRRYNVDGSDDDSFQTPDPSAYPGFDFRNILIQPKSLGGKIIVGLDTLRRFVP